jgi:biopolymer transport protein ExbB
VPAHLLSVETALGRRMSRTTVIIASVGATAPFIGLFGTVWGIMDSFIGINRTQSTNLASIAPGIAEALLTTALGLAAAIPAVLIYNGLARAINSYRALLADASNAAMCVLSLDVEQRQIGGAAERPVALREATHGH